MGKSNREGEMQTPMRFATIGAMVLAMGSATACASGAGGGLGGILGSVLGGGGNQQSEVSGQINGIDTRNRQIGLRQSNGQNVSIYYDQNTQVVYQNQSYPVTALENGDQVTLRLQQANNGGYYTDYVQVDQSVRNGGYGGNSRGVYQSGNVQMLEGSVRSINYQQGWFAVNMQNGGVVNVQLPQQVSRNDVSRFNALRQGEYVRFYGVVMGNNTVELRQFQ
jgi:outer membrane lipoprotein SlyB